MTPTTHRARVSPFLVAAFAAGLAFAACDSDPEPVAVSETVSLKLGGMKEGDAKSGTHSQDKNVNSESGNPYGEFLKTARDRLNRDPSEIRVRRVDVRLHADSTGATDLGQVFADLEVFLANSNTTIPLGTVDAPTGTSVQVPLNAGLSLDALQASLLSGDLKAGARGQVVDTPPAKYDVRLTIDISFEALP